MKRRLELTITNCFKCPYRAYAIGIDYCWHPKFSGQDKHLPEREGMTTISIPNWCPLPYEVLT